MDVREKLVELLKKAKAKEQSDFLFADIDDAIDMPNGDEYLANYLIAHGVTVQEWISVGDPPKERGVYIVTVKHWLDGKPVTREAKWNGADWLSCYKAEEITPRVTHWQHLPQPPKGE